MGGGADDKSRCCRLRLYTAVGTHPGWLLVGTSTRFCFMGGRYCFELAVASWKGATRQAGMLEFSSCSSARTAVRNRCNTSNTKTVSRQLAATHINVVQQPAVPCAFMHPSVTLLQVILTVKTRVRCELILSWGMGSSLLRPSTGLCALDFVAAEG